MQQEYTIEFNLYIHGATLDAQLTHTVVLPFVPQIGMLIVDGDWNCVIEELIYDTKSKKFKCSIIDNSRYQQMLANLEPESVEGLIYDYEELGWKCIYKNEEEV